MKHEIDTVLIVIDALEMIHKVDKGAGSIKNQRTSRDHLLLISFRGARGVMVIVAGNEHGDTSSNLDETDCISHSTNTLGKGMNQIILPPAMGK